MEAHPPPMAVVGGAGNAVIGIVVFDQGMSQLTNILMVPFSIAVHLWLLVMRVLMRRKAGAAA